jgi:hypothetical protein
MTVKFDPYWVSAQKIVRYCPVCEKNTYFFNEYEYRNQMYFFCSECEGKAGIIFYYNGIIKRYTLHPIIFLKKIGNKKDNMKISFLGLEFPVRPMAGYGCNNLFINSSSSSLEESKEKVS